MEHEWKRVFLGLGSNVGNRLANLRQALCTLSEAEGIEVVRSSSVYETEPVGMTEQPAFLNLAAEIRTSLTPHELLRRCQSIEDQLGRVRVERWGPRTLDIDILSYGDSTVLEPELQVPHVEMTRRRFVLIPMDEIASDFVLPSLQKPISSLLKACPVDGDVRWYCSSNSLLAVEG